MVPRAHGWELEEITFDGGGSLIRVRASCYRSVLSEVCPRGSDQPTRLCAREGGKFSPGLAWKQLVREILAELVTSLVLVLPMWDAVADGSRSFHV